METKHTTTEWIARVNRLGHYTIESEHGNIAEVWAGENDPDYAMEANAKLIAASPELLAALIDVKYGLEIAKLE